MGILRTLFALMVLVGHAPYGSKWVAGIGGGNAVRMFYMISGFLISYVLIEGKSYKTRSSFYINRYLRLFPVYIVVALIALSGKLLASNCSFKDVYHNSPLTIVIMLVMTNLFIFGQDWIMFLGVKNHEALFSANFRDSDILVYQGLLIPQAWTLGVELTFYLVAPFILKSKKIIVTILAISLLLRLYFLKINLGNDPWGYRFFPLELSFFLLGALSHQVIMPLYVKYISGARLRSISIIATFLFVGISFGYKFVPLNGTIKVCILTGLFFAALPLTMLFQNKHKFDKRIGELSYPIYICHMICIFAVVTLCSKFGIHNNTFMLTTTILATLAFAALLNHYVAVPFESIRRRIKQEGGFIKSTK